MTISILMGMIIPFAFIGSAILSWREHVLSTKYNSKAYGKGSFDKAIECINKYQLKPCLTNPYIWESQENQSCFKNGALVFDGQGMLLSFWNWHKLEWHRYRVSRKIKHSIKNNKVSNIKW